jgi:hypothetical protein
VSHVLRIGHRAIDYHGALVIVLLLLKIEDVSAAIVGSLVMSRRFLAARVLATLGSLGGVRASQVCGVLVKQSRVRDAWNVVALGFHSLSLGNTVALFVIAQDSGSIGAVVCCTVAANT